MTTNKYWPLDEVEDEKDLWRVASAKKHHFPPGNAVPGRAALKATNADKSEATEKSRPLLVSVWDKETPEEAVEARFGGSSSTTITKACVAFTLNVKKVNQVKSAIYEDENGTPQEMVLKCWYDPEGFLEGHCGISGIPHFSKKDRKNTAMYLAYKNMMDILCELAEQPRWFLGEESE